MSGVEVFSGTPAFVGITGAHALMREDNLVKLTRVAGSSIKSLCYIKKLSLFPATETLTGPSIVSGDTKNRLYVLRHTVTTMYNILHDQII